MNSQNLVNFRPEYISGFIAVSIETVSAVLIPLLFEVFCDVLQFGVKTPHIFKDISQLLDQALKVLFASNC